MLKNDVQRYELTPFQSNRIQIKNRLKIESVMEEMAFLILKSSFFQR